MSLRVTIAAASMLYQNDLNGGKRPQNLTKFCPNKRKKSCWTDVKCLNVSHVDTKSTILKQNHLFLNIINFPENIEAKNEQD